MTPVPPYLFPKLGEEGTFREKSRFVGRQIFRFLEGRPAYQKRPEDELSDDELWQFENKYRSLVEQQEKYLAKQLILYEHRYPVDYSQLLSKKQVQEIVLKNLPFFEENKARLAYVKLRGRNEQTVELPFACYDADLANLHLRLRNATTNHLACKSQTNTPSRKVNWHTNGSHNPYVWRRA